MRGLLSTRYSLRRPQAAIFCVCARKFEHSSCSRPWLLYVFFFFSKFDSKKRMFSHTYTKTNYFVCVFLKNSTHLPELHGGSLIVECGWSRGSANVRQKCRVSRYDMAGFSDVGCVEFVNTRLTTLINIEITKRSAEDGEQNTDGEKNYITRIFKWETLLRAESEKYNGMYWLVVLVEVLIRFFFSLLVAFFIEIYFCCRRERS